jgi:CheY-like chemotaxis protein
VTDAIGSETGAALDRRNSDHGSFAGYHILLVEDEIILADILLDYLKAEGAHIIGPVDNVEDALSAVRTNNIDAAILDINLRGERTYAIADKLQNIDVPFIFLTGNISWAAPGYDTVPMLQKPFDHGLTQQGNNNAYAQDNEITWLDWERISDEGRNLTDFTRKLIEIRRSYPILHRGRFLVGEYNEDLDVRDVTWLSPSGKPMSPEQWTDNNAKCFGMLLDGRAQPTGIKRRGDDATLLIVMNAHHDVVEFTLPATPHGRGWIGVVDTNDPERHHNPIFDIDYVYEVTGRSLLVFVLKHS